MTVKVQLNDQEGFLGKIPDTAINTPRLLTADMVGMLYNSMQPPLPDVVRTADQQVGDGNERAQRLRRGWIIPVELPFSGLVSAETSARLGSRALGGTRTPSAELAPVGSLAFDVTTLMQTKAQGRSPVLSTVGFDLSGYKFVYGSLAVDNYEMAFEGSNDVTFSAGLRNTGIHRINKAAAALEADGFSAAHAAALEIAVAIVPPAPPTHHLMHPAAIKVTFNDGVARDFAVDGDLISGSCGISNAIVVKQMPGDPFLVPTVRRLGAYARDIHRGTRVPMARLKVALDPTLRGFVLAQNGADITDLTYLFRSEDAIGAAANNYFYEVEWKCPLSEIEAATSDPDGEDAAISMSFYPKNDPVTGSYWIQRVRTTDIALQ